MLEQLLKLLKEQKDIEYKLTIRKKYGPESFYVKKSLEMNRFVDVVHIYLTVYKVFEENGVKFRGSATKEVHSTSSVEEMQKDISGLAYAAGFVKNAYYPLAQPAKEQPKTTEITVFDKQKLYITLEKLQNLVFAQDKHDKGYLSYSEYFVKRNEIRIINSLGVDVSYAVNDVYVETAATWKNDGKEIEVYQSYDFADESTDLMSDKIKMLFEVASKKPQAIITPSFDGNVLIKGEALREFFYYYISNANAMSVFTKQSTFKAGTVVQGENITGDKVSITLKAQLAGSSLSALYDVDGLPLKDTKIIEKGKLLQYWGNLMGSSYLGVEVTGHFRNYQVSGGTFTEAQLKKEPYLEIVSFSDFQMDALTGDFGSEIRLGYYFDGKTVVAVTGGSVSGNIKNVQENMQMTSKTAQYNNFVGPEIILIKNVTISGS